MSRLQQRLTRALVLGLQDWGELAFAESQRIVNVDTGTLKKSGFFKRNRDGFTFGYRTPYAADVNNGWAAGTVTVPSFQVRPHRRQLPHWQTRQDLYKLGMAPRPRKRWQSVKAYRVASHTRYRRAYPGSHYMERSVDKFYGQLGKIVGRRLRRISA